MNNRYPGKTDQDKRREAMFSLKGGSIYISNSPSWGSDLKDLCRRAFHTTIE
mgnify:CR=1 FL=1